MLIYISISVYCYFCSYFSDSPFYQLFDTTSTCTEPFFLAVLHSSVLLKLRANHTDFFPLSEKLVSWGLKKHPVKKAKYLINELFEVVLPTSANDKHLSWTTSSCYFCSYLPHFLIRYCSLNDTYFQTQLPFGIFSRSLSLSSSVLSAHLYLITTLLFPIPCA